MSQPDDHSLSEIIDPPQHIKETAHISSLEQYKKLYNESITDPESFWSRVAREKLDWITPFTRAFRGSFKDGSISWFCDGKLNVTYNCVDRHLPSKADQVALLWESDSGQEIRRITYKELYEEVCRLANLLLETGVKKGDTVTIYLPMVPEAVYAMLACARIGAVHSVVFAGFSSESLHRRLIDASSRVIITADQAYRAGKRVPLKETVDAALHNLPFSPQVFVLKRTGADIPFDSQRDRWLLPEMKRQRPYCPAEVMDSESPLFLLYTSGSTGLPKGLLHTTAGYLLYVSLSFELIFDYHPGQIHACVADVGWITGHSYIVYGPLACGATTFLFEGHPLHPSPSRYWEMVERHGFSSFYTAPTALRALMRYGTDPITKHNRSSLRVLGTVGEPIDPQTWKWYYEAVGDKKCSIVDTYFQTETGGHLITSFPGAVPMKPGSATLPFYGIIPRILDPLTSQPAPSSEKGVSGVLVLEGAWPAVARTVYKDHQRYMDTYFNPYHGYYFTGDGATIDSQGYVWIKGRVDDVITKCGHRLGTAEIESALLTCFNCSETAVIDIPDQITGQAIVAYCVLKQDVEETPEICTELKLAVRKEIGPIAVPDFIILVPGLPKTRSGKIMRRILRKMAAGETEFGDVSTLADPSVIDEIKPRLVTYMAPHHAK